MTIVLHAAIDHNGAFHRDPYMTAVLTNTNINALLIEGGTTLDEYKNQITPLATTYGNNDKIDQVMFAGHGGSRIIEMAGTISENTVETETYGTIRQDEEAIDLNGDLVAAQAFFDEILANMDPAVVAPVMPGGLTGPAAQANRRILFNACLTNSNEVGSGLDLTTDRGTARRNVRDYITNNSSLATYMQTYAKSKGSDDIARRERLDHAGRPHRCRHWPTWHVCADRSEGHGVETRVHGGGSRAARGHARRARGLLQ